MLPERVERLELECPCMLFAGMSSCRILLLRPVLFLGIPLTWIRSHSPHPFSPHSHPQKQSLWQKFPCSYFTLASAPRTGETGRVTQGRRESHSNPDPDPNPLWGWSPEWAPGPPLGPSEELCKGGLRCISLRDWLQLSQVKVTLRGQLPALQGLCICQIDWVHPHIHPTSWKQTRFRAESEGAMANGTMVLSGQLLDWLW